MEEVSIIGINLAKRSFQVHGEGGRVCGLPPEAEPREASGVSRRPSALCGGDGGVRQRPLLGPGDHGARPRGEAGSAGLREAVRQAAQERRRGRGGDHGSGAAADHAPRGGQDGRAASACDALSDARPAGAPAHADQQRTAGPPGRVRRRGSSGAFGICCSPTAFGTARSAAGS